MTDLDLVTGELIPTPPRTLFQTDDPTEVLAAARTVAEALKGALEQGGMVQKIGPSEHVRIDGWQTLGSMLGIAPHVVWSRPMEGGWEARAEARTADGRVVGSAEAMCTHEERNWRRSDEYALRSMAQTRAMSKALRGPLGFIITLAGKSATPAEEVPDQHQYGPGATTAETTSMRRATQIIHGDDYDPTDLHDRLVQDAGGYLPKIVARAVMLIAAHRPGREAPAGTGTEGNHPQSAPTPSEQTPEPDTTTTVQEEEQPTPEPEP